MMKLHQLKLHQLVEILGLNQNNFNTIIEYQVECVSIFLDMDPEIIWEKDNEFLKYNFNLFNKIINNKSTSKDIIEINNEPFHKIKFEKLTLGEYIDLDYYSTQADGLQHIIPILYRRLVELDEFTVIQYQGPSKYSVFLDTDISDVIGVKYEFDEWKSRLLETYSGLFEMQYEDDEESEEPSTITVRQARQEVENRNAFNWESTILHTCNQDITKVESVLEMPVILFFNLLSSIKINQK